MSEFFAHYPQLNYDISGVKPVKTKKAIKGLKVGYLIIIHSNNLVLGFHQIRMVAW